jgi:hypothetical protein
MGRYSTRVTRLRLTRQAKEDGRNPGQTKFCAQTEAGHYLPQGTMARNTNTANKTRCTAP